MDAKKGKNLRSWFRIALHFSHFPVSRSFSCRQWLKSEMLRSRKEISTCFTRPRNANRNVCAKRRRPKACGTHDERNVEMSMEWLMSKKEESLLSHRGPSEMENMPRNFHFFFSFARLAHLVGKKANDEEERWWRRRRKSFRENSFSHGHTHHHELHTCRPKTGSWGSDLWPLCRVPPFNNQWSWRANFPFYFSHILAIVMSLHFHPPPLDPHHKNALFTAFRSPTDCIQFSNLNRDVQVEILMETPDRKSRSTFFRHSSHTFTIAQATIVLAKNQLSVLFNFRHGDLLSSFVATGGSAFASLEAMGKCFLEHNLEEEKNTLTKLNGHVRLLNMTHV